MGTQQHHRHHHQHHKDTARSLQTEDSSIRAMAYQIHREKGGHALDNWLEAERLLRNNH